MKFITYEQFGVGFVRRAVTSERVERAIAEVAGDVVEVGPISGGPGGVATVKASGKVGAPQVDPAEGDLLAFTAKLPIDLELEVRLAGVPTRYQGQVDVPLVMTVRTAEPLSLVIDIEELNKKDVRVDLQSTDIHGGVLQKVGNIDDEVRSRVASIVNKRLSSEKAVEARVIDIGKLVDKAW